MRFKKIANKANKRERKNEKKRGNGGTEGKLRHLSSANVNVRYTRFSQDRSKNDMSEHIVSRVYLQPTDQLHELLQLLRIHRDRS